LVKLSYLEYMRREYEKWKDAKICGMKKKDRKANGKKKEREKKGCIYRSVNHPTV
jgi:hypothetical protein